MGIFTAGRIIVGERDCEFIRLHIYCIFAHHDTTHTLLPTDDEHHARIIVLTWNSNFSHLSVSTYWGTIDSDQYIEFGGWIGTDINDNQRSRVRSTDLRELLRKLHIESDNIPAVLLLSKEYGTILSRVEKDQIKERLDGALTNYNTYSFLHV